jgi:hypothetical protein
LLNLQIEQFVAHALETIEAHTAARHNPAGNGLGILRNLGDLPHIARSVGVGDIVACGIQRALADFERLHANEERCVQASHSSYIWHDQVWNFNLGPETS